MATTNAYPILVVFLFLLGVTGCATSPAPRTWLRAPSEQQFETCGAWTRVQTVIDSVEQTSEGELLAVTPDSLVITTPFGCTSYARADITEVTLAHYRSQHPALAGWTTIGALSTLSHGIALIGTFPLWLITGITCTASASREPFVHYRPNQMKAQKTRGVETQQESIERDWRLLSRYARFPQGIPEAVNRADIRPFVPPPEPPNRTRRR